MKGGKEYMGQSKNTLETAVDLLVQNSLPHKNTIIIGDNAAGKSKVIKCYVKHRLEQKQMIYYMDAVNRYFSVSSISASPKKLVFSNLITETRIKDENFNLEDTWSYYGTPTERIEMIYNLYENEVQEMFCDFTGINFRIFLKESQDVEFKNGIIGKLSSGYQALLRMFLEMIYIRHTLEKEADMVVVIDEADEFLSPKNARKLYDFLIKRFPDLSFIFSTHSVDFIAGAAKANILILKDTDIEVLDADDYQDVSDVAAIFKEVFGNDQEKGNAERTDEKLRLLINNRIASVWSENEEKMLNEIEESELSAAQKLIYHQIKEW